MSEPNGRLLSDFKVAELKVELEKRGLPTQGIKVGLVERMSKWMIDNGLNPMTHVFDGSTPCSPTKTTTVDALSTDSPASPSTTTTTEREKKVKKEDEETPSTTTTQEEEKKEEVKDEVKKEEEKKEDDKQSDVVDVAKEKEMAARSVWIKNLKSGTKALEIKGMCMPIGHVVRAKMFTVKSKEPSGGLTGLGYVTFNTLNEADMAVMRLDKTQCKGVTVEVNKASPHNLPFLKTKKTPSTPVVSTTTPTVSTTNGEKKEEGKKKETKKDDDKTSRQKEETTVSTPSVKEEDRFTREKTPPYQRPTIPPRFPPKNNTATANSGKKQSSDGRRSSSDRDKEKEKNELARKLAEKEREHKKREEELKLQKEKERIRYEKEKVEKEKLRLQLDKLKAEMARGGGGGRGEKREERSGRDEREKMKERERERKKDEDRERDRKRERASYIAPAVPQRSSREQYVPPRPSERMRDDRMERGERGERKREAFHPSRTGPPVDYRDKSLKRHRPASPRRDNRDNRGYEIRSLSSSAFLPTNHGSSRSYSTHEFVNDYDMYSETYPVSGSGWTGGTNYNTAAFSSPWAPTPTVPQYPPYQRRY